MSEDVVYRNGKPLNPNEFENIDESERTEAMRRHHAARAAQFHSQDGQSSATRWFGTPRRGKHNRKLQAR